MQKAFCSQNILENLECTKLGWFLPTGLLWASNVLIQIMSLKRSSKLFDHETQCFPKEKHSLADAVLEPLASC